MAVSLAAPLAGCTGQIETGAARPDGGADLPDARPLPDGYPDSYDVNLLMTDADITVGNDISAAQVQEFLAQQGSFLAGYADPVSGDSAAALIAARSQAHAISPLYLLARIQTESSLITSGTDAYLDQATGCGCPDGSGCDPQLGGFGNQVECAAQKMRSYLDDLDQTGVTVAGWSVGAEHQTGDPCTVTPGNRATAALYTYTPWVGAYGMQCGRSDIGGSSLVALAYNRFLSEYHWGTDP